MSREQKIKEFMKREGITTLNEIDTSQEAYYSSQGCEICDDFLGQDVYDCHGFHPQTNNVIDNYKVCLECLYFINYGEEIE